MEGCESGKPLSYVQSKGRSELFHPHQRTADPFIRQTLGNSVNKVQGNALDLLGWHHVHLDTLEEMLASDFLHHNLIPGQRPRGIFACQSPAATRKIKLPYNKNLQLL